MPDVFLSYSRRDSEFVARLAEGLKVRGKDVWFDIDGIRDAELFPLALRRAIEGSDAFVFVISPESVASAFCEQEVAHAAELNKRIVPLVLRVVPDEQIPDEIRYRNWIPVGGEGTSTVERVVAAIETDLDWERQHTRLTVKALEWDGAERDGSFLLRGSDLAAAEHWLAQGAGKDPGPTELEQEYLLAARQAAGRRQRTLVGVSLAVAAVALALLIFALISRGQAVTAETNAKAQALAAISDTQQSVDPEVAVLLGIAAVREKATYGTLGTMFALRAALDASTVRYALPSQNPQGCGGPGVAYDPAPHSNLLAEALCDGEIVFADAASGRVERTVRVRGAGALQSLRYTDDGSALITATGRRLLELDPVTGAVRAHSPPLSSVAAFAVDPRAPVVAAAGFAGVALWNLATGRLTVVPVRALAQGMSSSIAFSPDGSRVAIALSSASSGGGPGLIVYDLAARRLVGSLSTAASVVAFSPDGGTLAVGELLRAGGMVVLLDARTLRQVGRPVKSVADVAPSAIAFNGDGSLLAYGFHDGTAGVWSLATRQTVHSYMGDSANITAIGFRPDGALLASGSADGTVRAWKVGDLALASAPAGAPLADVAADAGGFVTLQSPGPRPGEGVVAQRWLDDGQPAAPPLVLSPSPQVDALLLGAAGQTATVILSNGADSPTGRAEVWSIPRRRMLHSVALTLPGGYEPVMSPNGKLIAMNVQSAPSASSRTPAYDLDVLDLSTGKQTVLARETACTAGWNGFSFSSSSSLLAAGTFCGSHIEVHDLATGRTLGAALNLAGGQLSSTAFRPDGRAVAVAAWNGDVKVSPVPLDPRQTVTLTENLKGAPGVAYSPDGRYLASAGLDGTVRIFDADNLDELRVIDQPDPAYGVAFTTDSRDLLSWGSDHTVRLWDACTDCDSPTALVALARTRVTRQLTPQERAEYGVS